MLVKLIGTARDYSKELTDMIKKKTPKKKPQDKDPDELTEEDIESMRNLGEPWHHSF